MILLFFEMFCSIHSEERKLLRLRAWAQRNQEASQAKELNPENMPLFGEPYKTNKGDELSNRIQKMLGSYEDVNNPYPFAIESLPIPTYVTFSQSDQGQPNTDKPTRPPLHDQVHYMSTQRAPSGNGYSSQPERTSAASSSPNHQGHSSTFSSSSLNHSQLSSSAHQQKKSEPHSDLREHVGLPQEMSSQTPDAKQLPFLRSSDRNNTDMDTKDTFDRHLLQGSTDHSSESASIMDVSTFIQKHSPKDASLPQGNKSNSLPSQTFPSLLSSKQPSVVMTQKPTAYVRPMDGQDQVVSESPELKPSPEPYVPLPELINKSDLGKTKILAQFLETRTNEAQCVEDILREMTHSWPPLLTAIHTPSTGEPSKSPFSVKIRDLLTNRPQVVRIGDNTSSTLVLSTGTPQGCVLSPALFTLFTSDCSAIHSTNTIVKFADDTTIVGSLKHAGLSSSAPNETSTGPQQRASSASVQQQCDMDSIYAGQIQKKAVNILHRPYPPELWTVCTASLWKTVLKHKTKTTRLKNSFFPRAEAEHVSSHPGQKNHDASPADPSQLIQQSSSSLFEAAHSTGAESASSSDSESSSRSESDSESTTEEPPQQSLSTLVKSEPDAPAVTHGDWQLGNWIRSSQQSSSTESQSGAHSSESPTCKQPPPTQSSKRSSVEVVDPTRESKPQLSSHQKELSDCFGKPQQHSESPQDNYNKQSSQNPPSAELSCSSSRKLSRNTFFSKPAKAGCPDHTEAALGIKCEEAVVTRDKDPSFTDRPKVKTKTGHSKKRKECSDTKRDGKRTSKHAPLDKRKAGADPESTLVQYGHCPSCGVSYPTPCSCPTQSPPLPDQLSPAPPVRISCSKPKSDTICQKGTKVPHKATPKLSEKTTGHTTKSSRHPNRPPRSLLVKIDLSLLSRVPQTSGDHQEISSNAKRSALVIEQDGGGSDASATHKLTKTIKKSIPQNVEVDNKSVPRKKPRLENKNTSSAHTSVKLQSSSISTENQERKKAKKNPASLPATHKDTAKVSLGSSVETQESCKEAVKSKEPRKHRKSSGKHTEHPHFEKQKAPKISLAVSSSSQSTRETLTNRPLLRFEDRQYPVKHYIKEAKKLKHKADAESDKLSKAFTYLEAAMYFVESGIAMEKDPQISMSSYTMFAETVELLKFVLKLKNSVDPSAPPSEKDFLALCLKCQSLLQMAMFRHKNKTALKFSKTLTDHFNNSAQKSHDSSVLTPKDTPSPMPNMPSPANTSTSSGPGSNHSSGGSIADPVSGTVVVPQAIEQVAFTYVNITTLFLSAHDLWEQATELAQKGSGVLIELDRAMGPLSLTSSMSSVVHYTRQGIHWLRLDSQKVK
ncbi:hypothetical protein L3Q82_012548 [Scortum barcoo]|uniref:Uncharacterized protein n=1 Tax=Scortum barcoo TaxID=214431 RepID=A0ACB8W442_9TELE|nr:hypothetical protein L3Q82_012548 [Scortum barcoo]